MRQRIELSDGEQDDGKPMTVIMADRLRRCWDGHRSQEQIQPRQALLTPLKDGDAAAARENLTKTTTKDDALSLIVAEQCITFPNNDQQQVTLIEPAAAGTGKGHVASSSQKPSSPSFVIVQVRLPCHASPSPSPWPVSNDDCHAGQDDRRRPPALKQAAIVVVGISEGGSHIVDQHLTTEAITD